jgi:chemotaxis signal transduction protein
LAEMNNAVAADVIDVIPEEELRVCLFSMGADLFAVPVDTLTEIIISQKIFPVPTTPPHVLGVINLRGNIVPIVDIRTALSLPRNSNPSQIAIIRQGALIIGIVVDTVSEVVSVPVNKILAIPAEAVGQAGKGRSRFLKSIIQREGSVAALLDVQRILEEIKLE